MNAESGQTLSQQLEESRTERLNIASFSRGIDSYNIDVWLSPTFDTIAEKVATMLVSQIGVPNPKNWDNSKDFQRLRNCYLDLMTVLIHRVKTDLDRDQVCLLQFATIKRLLLLVKQALEGDIANAQDSLTEHRQQGSSGTLAVNQRLFWLKKNYDSILYKVNKQIFSQLQRVEERHLKIVRDKNLGKQYDFLAEVLTNPLLYVSELSALALLMDEFNAWTCSGNDETFIELNNRLEKLLNKRFKPLKVSPLRNPDGIKVKTEIHDELGGLFACQAFLGPAEDTRNEISETLNWFEITHNLEKLHEVEKGGPDLGMAFRNFGQYWRQRKKIKLTQRVAKGFLKILKTHKVLAQAVASLYMKRQLPANIGDRADLKDLCQYLAGKIHQDKIQLTIPGGKPLSDEQFRTLATLRESIAEKIKSVKPSVGVALLRDFSRYRRLLKQLRFAHRAFNRIRLLSEEDDLKLSKTAGSLYKLPIHDEIEEDDQRFVHHAVLKADIRGSTLVTQDLLQKGLNPASYFSTRFFNPINNSLQNYGANKVFIEGDAIILSFLEQENLPQQWFAVSRACGIAKEMLKIVAAKNRHSTQMDLPLLELGIGICFSEESPNFLYDGDRPIMISNAIAESDRMSSCSWKLRKALARKGLYNVRVFRVDDEETAEKGQRYLRFNVNGINLDSAAFSKLGTEVVLTTIKIRINNEDQLFHVGQYPDAKGVQREVVVREGKIGLWKDGAIVENTDVDEAYYEVVVSRKVLPLVLEHFHQSQTVTVND